MKQKASKKITSLLLALALLVGMVALPSTALTANAAGIGKPSDIAVDRTGIAVTGNTIMFGENNLQSVDGMGDPVGTPDGNPIKWRVVANDGTTITLLADNKLGNRRYDPAEHQLWSGSDICNYLNGTGIYSSGGFLQNSFSAGERSAMVSQYGTANEAGDYQNIDSQQTIVLPSDYEMKNNGTWGFTIDTERQVNPLGDWWLRSAGFDYNFAAIVINNGNVISSGVSVGGDHGIRPAFKINLTSVIFSSSAVGGKPTTVGANLSAASQPTAALKLTVLDTNTGNLNLSIADTSARTAAQGETISIPYTGAVVGAGTKKFVSCVIENSTGVQYYAKLTDTANGTANIALPANMSVGNYTIKLFNEQCNADNYTDYASTPISIDLTVQAPVSPTINGSTTATDSITVIEGYAAQTKTYTMAGLPTPTMAVTSDGGTGATVSTAGVLSIPARLGIGAHNIVLTASNGHLPNATTTVTLNVLETPTVPTVTPASLTIQAGGTGSFAVAMGTGTDQATSVSIASDNTAVATVDQASLTANGNVTVTGVAEGTANINLTWTGGSKAGTTETVAITVTKKPTTPVTPEPPVVGTAAPAVTSANPINLDLNGNATGFVTVTLGASGVSGDVLAGQADVTVSGSAVTATPAALTADGNVTITAQSVGTAKITIAFSGKDVTGDSYNRSIIVNVTDSTKTTTTSGGGSSGSGGGGSNKPDSRPVVGGTTTSTTRPLTKADATKLFDTALAAKPAGATTLSIKVQNKTSVTKEVLAELAALAKKNGVSLTVHFDTVVGGKVVGRISVNPALVTTNLDLTITENKALATRFAKYYSNPLAVFTIKAGGSVAIPLPANLKAEGLVIYSYDTATNTYTAIPNAKPWVDKNGYLHFELPAGTEVVISQGKLVKK